MIRQTSSNPTARTSPLTNTRPSLYHNGCANGVFLPTPTPKPARLHPVGVDSDNKNYFQTLEDNSFDLLVENLHQATGDDPDQERPEYHMLAAGLYCIKADPSNATSQKCAVCFVTNCFDACQVLNDTEFLKKTCDLFVSPCLPQSCGKTSHSQQPRPSVSAALVHLIDQEKFSAKLPEDEKNEPGTCRMTPRGSSTNEMLSIALSPSGNDDSTASISNISTHHYLPCNTVPPCVKRTQGNYDDTHSCDSFDQGRDNVLTLRDEWRVTTPINTVNNLSSSGIQDCDIFSTNLEQLSPESMAPQVSYESGVFCAQLNTGAWVSCTGTKSLLHDCHDFSPSLPSPILLLPATEGSDGVSHGYGFLHVPACTPSGFCPARCYYHPGICTTILDEPRFYQGCWYEVPRIFY